MVPFGPFLLSEAFCPSLLQRFEPRVSSQRCGAGLPSLLSGVSRVALPNRSHYCQPAAKRRALIGLPCLHQAQCLLPGMKTLRNGISACLQHDLSGFSERPPLFQGSHVYLEHAGDLRLFLADKDQARGEVHCFSLAEGALFVEAIPQMDISRKITAFQYELVPSQGPGAHMYPYLHSGSGNRQQFFFFFKQQDYIDV